MVVMLNLHVDSISVPTNPVPFDVNCETVKRRPAPHGDGSEENGFISGELFNHLRKCRMDVTLPLSVDGRNEYVEEEIANAVLGLQKSESLNDWACDLRGRF